MPTAIKPIQRNRHHPRSSCLIVIDYLPFSEVFIGSSKLTPHFGHDFNVGPNQSRVALTVSQKRVEWQRGHVDFQAITAHMAHIKA
jgi:hypothetical protein